VSRRSTPPAERPAAPGPALNLSTAHLVLLVTVSFVLLFFSFPPYVRDSSVPVWVALVPMLIAARVVGYRRLALVGCILGIGYGFASVFWLRHVGLFQGMVALLSLSLYLSFYPPLFLMGWKLLDRRLGLPAAVTVPLVWVALEYVRSFLLTGFPWFYLGHSLYRNLHLIQIADLFGAYGVSVLVAAVNGLVADVLWPALSCRAHDQRGTLRGEYAKHRGKLVVSAGLVGAALAATLAYGTVRLRQVVISEGPRVALIQGNIAQSLKFRPLETERIFAIHRGLSLEALTENPDLIIWPETMLPGVFFSREGYFGTYSRTFDLDSKVRQLMAELGRPLLAGARSESASGDQFNSALLLTADGEVVAMYSKMHLVPFGEFVPRIVRAPFRLLPDRLNPIPYRFGLKPGRAQTIFEVTTEEGPDAKPFRFGVLICYEDIIPGLARGLARRGVDCLVNITNDGWFKDSAELDQHVIGSVFRAVETRKPVLRAANTGITSIISPHGEEVVRLRDPATGSDREVAGYLVYPVPLSPPLAPTLYVRWGDLPVQVMTAVALLLLVFAGEKAWQERKTAKSDFF